MPANSHGRGTTKPAQVSQKAKRQHPWRTWVPKAEKKPGDVFVPRIPASARMGLSL